MTTQQFIEKLETSYESFTKEYHSVINDHHFLEWPEKFLYNDGWNVFGLRFQRNDIAIAHQICPILSSFVHEHDALIDTIGFSKLKPGTVIKPHVGYTDTVWRCHLGIDVPPGDCKLRVGSDFYEWKNGKAFVFDDTIEHEAWNKTDKERIVLLLDLVKAKISH